MNNGEDLRREFKNCLLEYDRNKFLELTSALSKEHSFQQLVDRFLVPVLEEVGTLWQDGKIALSQVYLSSRMIEGFFNDNAPTAKVSGQNDLKIAVAVLDDFHLLGKRLVLSSLRIAGYSPLDFGRCKCEELVNKTRQERIEVLCVSVLMLRSALMIKDLKEQLAHLNYPVKLIVGGAPFRFDKNLYLQVGADMCGDSAFDVIELVKLSKQVKS